MRRPALHRQTGPVNTSAWAHPYPTGLFSPVFYASGDPTDPPAGDPDPADPPQPGPPAGIRYRASLSAFFNSGVC